MADSQIIPSLSGFYAMDMKTGAYRYGRTAFWSAGQDSFTRAPAQNQDTFELLENTMPVVDGTLPTRWGYGAFAAAQTAAIRRWIPYYNDNTGVRAFMGIVPASTPYVFMVNEAGTAYGSAFNLPAAVQAAAQTLYGAVSRDYLYMLDGQAADQLKWSGASSGGFTKWGIDAPVTAIAVGAPTSGGVTISEGRQYFAVFTNTTTGHSSDLNPVSASSGPLTSQQVPLSSIPQPSDSQVNKITILSTADGGDETTLYQLGQVAVGTTTFTDNEPEDSLLLLPVWQDTDSTGVEHGVADNTPPTTTNGIVISHLGRLFILDGGNLYFSKNLDEVTTSSGDIVGRWEEAWPGTNQMAISKEAEIGTALFSDGVALYIGTTRTVWRLLGSGPSTFSEPETIYGDAGVANQDVLQRVFVKGQSIGMAWLTPDLRVIVSDFNSYTDVGTPIQDVLNSINPAALSTACATFVTNGPYDLYVLAVPISGATSPNVLCVYDLRRQMWSVWTLYDSVLSSLLFDIPNQGSPIWVFGDGTGGSWQFDSALSVDRSGSVNAAISCTARAAWQPLGDPALFKALNEFEIIATSPATLTIALDGATTMADFSSPLSIVSATTPTQSLLGSYKLFLGGLPGRNRFYRPTLAWTGPQVIGGWTFEAVPIGRI